MVGPSLAGLASASLMRLPLKIVFSSLFLALGCMLQLCSSTGDFQTNVLQLKVTKDSNDCASGFSPSPQCTVVSNATRESVPPWV